MSEQDWQRWLPDTSAGILVLLLGLAEALSTPIINGEDRAPYVGVAVGFGAAVGLCRHAPLSALGLVWLVAGLQVGSGVSIMYVELSVAVVAFGCARWGHPVTVVLSGLAIPAAALAALGLLATDRIYVLVDTDQFSTLVDSVRGFGDGALIASAVLGAGVLAAPWLAGLTLRYAMRASESQVSQAAAEDEAARAVHEREQAEEIARLREEQTRLARDVHDVVGHSLAVILAQAESAQYLKDADTQALKRTMETIATSARSSLQDVRQVLSQTQQRPAARPGGLDELVAGVRASGHEVVSSEVGTPHPLPPELETVAYRVLQEMLTNAIKHGRRDAPVLVERHWPDGAWQDELRIEVRNVSPAADETQPIGVDADGPAGRGLDGMRRRLESVGGRLDVRPRLEAEGPTFTVTAWVPVRPR